MSDWWVSEAPLGEPGHGRPASRRSKLRRERRRERGACVAGDARSDVLGRDEHLEADVRERHLVEVAPLARRASGRLPDDPRPRGLLDVGREVARRGEGRSAGQQRGPRCAVHDLALDRVEKRPVLLVVAAAVLTDVDDRAVGTASSARAAGSAERGRPRRSSACTRRRRRGPSASSSPPARFRGSEPRAVSPRRAGGAAAASSTGTRPRSSPQRSARARRLACPAASQRERHAFALGDSEPAQHLGADEVVRDALAEAPLVVARDQRPNARDDLVDRHALDRDELRTQLSRRRRQPGRRRTSTREPDRGASAVGACAGCRCRSARRARRGARSAASGSTISSSRSRPSARAASSSTGARTPPARRRVVRVRVDPLELIREAAGRRSRPPGTAHSAVPAAQPTRTARQQHDHEAAAAAASHWCGLCGARAAPSRPTRARARRAGSRAEEEVVVEVRPAAGSSCDRSHGSSFEPFLDLSSKCLDVASSAPRRSSARRRRAAGGTRRGHPDRPSRATR